MNPPSRLGIPHSPEARARISAALRGRRKPWLRERMQGNTIGLGNQNVLNAPVIGECVYCFGPAQTRDHVIPKSRGGTDDPENIVPCCFWCNRSKRNRTPEEWIAEVWPA